MAKEFNKKFMHPTRRKLVDMVLHGQEYETDTFVSFAGAEEANVSRKVGDRWTDSNGDIWEQKEFGKMKEFSQYIANFEVFVDRCNFSNNFIETTDNIYEYLWPGLDTIKNSQYKHLNHWKYAGELKLTEIAHSNGEKCFDLLNWEKRTGIWPFFQ